MSVSEQSLNGPLDAVKSDDGNDPLDTFIRQAISNEAAGSLQWVQLIHPFGQLGFGWPMVTPVKVQLLKCEKCSREFCSTMNYRRHIRMHRRSSNVDKESHKNRDLLGAFWDKLSLEEAGRVVSFDDISLEGVPGSLIVNAWASSIQKEGIVIPSSVYMRAGCILLEIIQEKSSRPPISSQELFSILDETSEGTFLSGGTAELVQKIVVDGGAEKVVELRNLVSSTSLLFEQNLVKAWLVEKDAEALRCQKILVEEEEMAQKRQAQTSEKKRRKKLRQKEQKARGKSTGEKTDSNAGEKMDSNADSLDSIADFVEGAASTETSIQNFPSDGSDTLTDLKTSLEQINSSRKEDGELVEPLGGHSSTHVGMDSTKNVVSTREWATNSLYQSTVSTWKVVKSNRRGQVALLGSQNLQASKLEAMQKKGPANELNTVANADKIWARKSITAIDEKSSRITVQNRVAKSIIDVKNPKISFKNIVAKGAINIGSSKNNWQNVVAKGSNDEDSSRAHTQNIVSKGKIDVENLRSTLQNVVAKSAIDLDDSGTSLQNVEKGTTDAESTKSMLQNVVAKSADTMQNAVAKSSNDEEQSRTILQNIVSKGETDVEKSRITMQNVVAKSADDVEIPKRNLQNVEKCVDDEDSSRPGLQNVAGSHIDMTNCKLFIGSISVPVSNVTAEQHASQGSTTDSSDKCVKSDAVLEGQDPAVAMKGNICLQWMRGKLSVQRGSQNYGEDDILGTVEDLSVTSMQSSVSKPNVSIIINNTSYTETDVQPPGSVFPNFDVKAFLSQRWRDAITSDHVKLVLSPEPPSDADGRNEGATQVQASGSSQYSEPGDAEASVAGGGPPIPFIKENSEAKFRKKD